MYHNDACCKYYCKLITILCKIFNYLPLYSQDKTGNTNGTFALSGIVLGSTTIKLLSQDLLGFYSCFHNPEVKYSLSSLVVVVCEITTVSLHTFPGV